MKKSNKKALLLILLLLIPTAYVLFSYHKFRTYNSEENREKLWLILNFLNGYQEEYGYVPDVFEFFEYIKSDTSFLYKNFPDFEFPDYKPGDFVIKTDYEYIYVWLFSETTANEDTLLMNQMTFGNFFRRASHLVHQKGYPDPCRPEGVYIEKDRVGIKNQELHPRIWKIVYETTQWQKEENPENHSFLLCCFHFYVSQQELKIGHGSRFWNCGIDEKLQAEILSRLSFLKEEYADYDFYIKFYIDQNR